MRQSGRDVPNALIYSMAAAPVNLNWFDVPPDVPPDVPQASACLLQQRSTPGISEKSAAAPQPNQKKRVSRKAAKIGAKVAKKPRKKTKILRACLAERLRKFCCGAAALRLCGLKRFIASGSSFLSKPQFIGPSRVLINPVLFQERRSNRRIRPQRSCVSQRSLGEEFGHF